MTIRVSLAANESGAATAQVVKLLTPEQVDASFKVNVRYQPPRSNRLPAPPRLDRTYLGFDEGNGPA